MIFTFSGFALNVETHVLSRDGVAQAVEPQVFDLLCLLAKQAGKLVTKDQMIAEIWGRRIASEATVDGLVASARRAVGDNWLSAGVDIWRIPRLARCGEHRKMAAPSRPASGYPIRFKLDK